MTFDIVFNRPWCAPRTAEYVNRAFENGQTAGNGPFSRECAEFIARAMGAPRVLMTPSCTDALEMAALLLDIHAGDEIIVPTYTFVSTANAFVLQGARPVFVDVRPDTLNMDERLVEAAITPRTRAIVVVHYAGVACDMDAVGAIARRHGIPIVEDNAHGLFARYRGRMLGTFGCLAAQSFHETKNYSCGEGGALVINDETLIDRAEIIHEKGTDRRQFFRGVVDKYTWRDIGSSFVLSDLLAACLAAQFAAASTIRENRQAIWTRYAAELAGWARSEGVQTPYVPAECEQPFHMFYLTMRTAAARDALIEHLAGHSILAVSHYQPLHLSRMGQRFGGRAGTHPVSESVSQRLVRLPFHAGLSASDQGRVIHAVSQFRT